MTTITITVRDDDGNLIDHELQPANPKRPIYVAVGEPGHRSGVWRIWGNPPTTGKSDVFVTARSIARVQKFSLHESGDFRHQWVTADAASRFTSSPDKLSKSLTVGESGRTVSSGGHGCNAFRLRLAGRTFARRGVACFGRLVT